MMRSLSTLLVVVWLVALCDVTGFSIRRRDASKSDLSEAFRVLERHRRRIRDDEYLAASRMPDPDSPILPSEVPNWQRDIPSREEQAWLADTFGLTPYDNSYPGEGYEEEEEEVEPGSPSSSTVEASEEELQSIFGGNKGDNSDVQDEVEFVDKKSKGEEGDDDNLTAEEFKALMRAVEKLQKKALVKKDIKTNISKVTTPQPVSKEELSAVFEDTDGDKNSDDESDQNTEVVSPETVSNENESEIGADEIKDAIAENINQNNDVDNNYKDTMSKLQKYWELNDYFNSEEKRRKRFTKRAPVPSPPNSVPLEETYLKEIDNLKDQIDKLKLLSQLEDMENDALTQTLNEATLTQMEGTVSLKEFGSLEQAIKLEEALQDLKNGKVNPLVVEMVASNAIRGFDKRGEPEWRKKEKKMDTAGLEDSYPMFEKKRQIEMPIYGVKRQDVLQGGYLGEPGEKRSLKRVKEEDVDRWYDRPAREDRSEERKRFMQAQDAIDSMVEQLAAEDLQRDQAETADDDDEDDDMLIPPPEFRPNPDNDVMEYSPDNEQGQCPSVTLLTDCKFADLQGLPIDEEARELCNRHEMCYECGATSGAKQGECDNLYRADAAALCEKDANCVIEAELFLQQMKLKHRYSRFYREVCDNSCTGDFIGI